MKVLIGTAALLLSAAAIFAGCGGPVYDGGGGGGGGGNGVKTFSDPSSTIEVETGEEFTIELESNATTGYSWELAEQLDEDVVELLGSEYIPEEGAEERVGAGGTEEWTFKAVGAGSTTISLQYVRSWEEEETPAKTADFEVQVD